LFSRIGLGEQALLQMKVAAGMIGYESQVIAGRVELLGRGSMDTKRGGLGVAIYLERLNYWEGEVVSVPLNNPHGTDVVDGLRLDNQHVLEVGKVNFALISGEDIGGEIPSPATVEIINDDTVVTDWLANIIVSQDVIYNLAVGDTFLDSGLANSLLNFGIVVNANSSGGEYGLLQWSTTDPTELLSWVIDNERAARFAGKLVRPVMRLQTAFTTDDYWIRCKVKQGQAVEYSRWQKMVPYQKMQILPAVHIPPKNLESAEIAGVVFALEGQRNLSGSHVMAIDDIDLLPVDGYRHYYPLGSNGLSHDEILVDEFRKELIYSVTNYGVRKLTHQASGKGIWLMPGKDQCIRVKWDNTNGNCNPNQFLSLKLSYRPRRKNL